MKQRHHRKCRSNGGTRSKANISRVKPTLHEAYHHLFGNADTFKVAEILNDTWIDPCFKLVVLGRN